MQSDSDEASIRQGDVQAKRAPRLPHRGSVRRHAIHLATLVAVCLLLLRFTTVADRYPYYVTWDMDLTATEDCVLIHSRLLPDLVSLPGFGMYFLLFFTQKAAYSIGAVSVLSLGDLAGSLNPLAGMAELTSFVRGHSPFLALGVVVMLWGALLVLFDPPPAWRLLLLVTLGAQESLLYHASMARASIYAMFYWSAAALLVAVAARTRGRPTRSAILFLAGLAAGLCFLTKMQSLFYVAALPFVYVLADRRGTPVPEPAPRNAGGTSGTAWTSGASWVPCGVSLLEAACFAVMLGAASRTPILEGMSRWDSAFGVTPLAVAFLLGLIGLAVIQGMFARRGDARSPLYGFTVVLTILLLGFLASFLLHFALFADPGQAMTYLLRDFKMIFLRNLHDPVEGYSQGYASIARDFVAYAPAAFAAYAAALVLVLSAIRLGAVAATRRTGAALAMLFVLGGLAVVPGARFILRDLVWAQVLLTFATVAALLFVVTRERRFRPILPVLAAGIAIVLTANHLVNNIRMPARIDANYNYYGWQDDPWFTSVYQCNQLKYRDLMASRYEGGRDVAKRQAAREQDIRRMVSFVFTNQRITHRNIGVVAKGFPVWTDDLEWRIAGFPYELREAILVDNGPVAVRDSYVFHPQMVRAAHEYLDKFRQVDDAKRLAVLGRPDLRILLFVNPEDAGALDEDQWVPRDDRIAVVKGDETRTLHGFEVWNYGEVALDSLSHPFFTVIQLRDPKLYRPYDVNTLRFL